MSIGSAGLWAVGALCCRAPARDHQASAAASARCTAAPQTAGAGRRYSNGCRQHGPSTAVFRTRRAVQDPRGSGQRPGAFYLCGWGRERTRARLLPPGSNRANGAAGGAAAPRPRLRAAGTRGHGPSAGPSARAATYRSAPSGWARSSAAAPSCGWRRGGCAERGMGALSGGEAPAADADGLATVANVMPRLPPHRLRQLVLRRARRGRRQLPADPSALATPRQRRCATGRRSCRVRGAAAVLTSGAVAAASSHRCCTTCAARRRPMPSQRRDDGGRRDA